MEITFVRTRYSYDPYIDFFRLAELSGFPIIYVDQLDVSQHGVFIVSPMNGEWRPHLDNHMDEPRNAHLILWNIERPSGSAGSVGRYAQDNRELLYQRYVDEIWLSDRRLAEETELRFVPLGSDEGLGQPGIDKKYHFCHMSYEVPRRQTVYKYFNKSVIGPNCWPPLRDEVLRQSKFALNVHQDNHPFQEPLRFALFAAYGLPILSETIYDPYPWDPDHMIFAPFDQLVNKMSNLLSGEYRPWKEMGLKARERMCGEFQFGKLVREAVSQSAGKNWR